MKNYLIVITLLFCFQANVFAHDIRYVENASYPTCNCIEYYYPNCVINRTLYNPYQMPYQIQRNVNYTSDSNTKAKRLKKIRRLQRLRDSYNHLTWKNKNDAGTLTGYTLPVTKDVFKQMGITPNNFNNNSQNNSHMYFQELFSTPSTGGKYYKNGKIYTDDGGISGSAGVKIIYD